MVELPALRTLSARVGADPHLVQGPGGNTSVKEDGILWVKASGTWLRDSVAREIFVPIDLLALLRGLEANDPACESSAAFVRSDLNASNLRPSIETAVHALMPQRVVLHVHCVNTIAWAIQENAEPLLRPKLRDQNWSFIPYVRPGLPLAAEISKRLRSPTDVLVLGNHGLVVASDSVEEAAKRLKEVCRLLERPAREMIAADLNSLARAAQGSYYRPAVDAETHALATDPHVLGLGHDAVYYPDHAVFLGVGVATSLVSQAPLVALAGQGVLIRESAKPAVEAMGRCLADVLRRVVPGEKIKRLAADEIGALSNWDAEHYRRNMSQK